ncbi:TetR/AcrR family transcriptional regulator [Dyadobacter frigoris]|uniref:TetR/AcrR family transcriptional regulator n=1 Tax=Dyadobacter frigoris TaxID=2576211 RepID=A0A4V6BIN7_9BACT|nr:TetR/AcrR family transcriptional regulator [Dyadobacter frigoris]TKT90253.1 TetR/AcrR family transcriptional regulator [Dyadobacter frigoris]GLU52489.1 transcriptional regulator [Dyadobacter frigoris]
MSKAEKTKAFIIEKTAPIFNRKGYAGTSINDMTDATGLTKGSIYGNFSNKDEVALAAFDYNLQKISTIFATEMSQQDTAKGQLLVFVHVYMNFLSHPFPSGGCPILNTAVEADDTHPELKKKVVLGIINWKNRITNVIEKGIEQKEFSSTTDPEQIALTIIATIEGGVMITQATGKLNYLKLIMKSVEKLINGLGIEN